MGITKENLKNILNGFYTKIKPELKHSNITTLNKLSENEDGDLVFNGKVIKGSNDETI